MLTAIPVPEILAQRAWECALDLLDEPGALTAAPAVMSYLAAAAVAGPAHLGWAHCQFLFRTHRHFRGEARQ